MIRPVVRANKIQPLTIACVTGIWNNRSESCVIIIIANFVAKNENCFTLCRLRQPLYVSSIFKFSFSVVPNAYIFLMMKRSSDHLVTLTPQKKKKKKKKKKRAKILISVDNLVLASGKYLQWPRTKSFMVSWKFRLKDDFFEAQNGPFYIR